MPPEADNFYQALAAHAGDAVVYVDAEGTVQFWNKGAERMLGFSRSEAIGQPIDLIIPHHLRERHWQGFRRVIRTGSTLPPGWVVTRAMRRDGSIVALDITILLLRRDDGGVRGIAAFLCPRPADANSEG